MLTVISGHGDVVEDIRLEPRSNVVPFFNNGQQQIFRIVCRLLCHLYFLVFKNLYVLFVEFVVLLV